MLERMENVENIVKELLSKIVEENERKLLKHDKDMERLEAEIKNIEKQIVKKQNEIEDFKSQKSDDREEFEEKERLALWINIQETYERNLGLQIRKISPYMLEISFLYITPHYTENRIQLYLSPEGLYTVTECMPKLSNLSGIISDLNTTKNLTAFFVSLRKAFQSTY